MKPPRTFWPWVWKIPLCGTVHALGTLLGVAAVGAVGLRMPRPIEGADPTTQALLLVPAGMAIALGMAAAAVGLPGSRWQRAAVLAAFMFTVQGIGNAIEASIFTTLGGAPATIVMLLPASILCAMAVSWLFPAPDAARPGEVARSYFAQWRPGSLTGRLALALAAFPFVYLLFGMLISPIVVSYYEQIDFLVIPPMPVLLGVLFTRSVLLLLASVPIIVLWRGSRTGLVVGLGLAHYAAVGLAGLILGTFLPAILRWTHGIEVFADSLCYALVLTWLLARPVTHGEGSQQATGDQTSESPHRHREAVMTTNNVGRLSLVARIAALTVVLIFVQGMGARFLPAVEDAAQPSGSFFLILITVLLLQTIALAYPVIRSRWHGWLLAGTVFVLYFGTVTFQSQIESWIYLGRHMSPAMLRGIFLMGLFTAAVFSPILVLALGRWRARADDDHDERRLRMPGATWAWRLLLGSVVFVALYYLFGYYVAWKNPLLREYYGGTDPGSFVAQMSGIVRDTPSVLALQFARGLFWVLIALPVIRMMKGPWWEAGLALSLLFTVPTVYLLFPNPLMPEAVRMTHLVETAPYQFLFGWFVAWLFTRAPRHGLSLPHHHATRA